MHILIHTECCVFGLDADRESINHWKVFDASDVDEIFKTGGYVYCIAEACWKKRLFKYALNSCIFKFLYYICYMNFYGVVRKVKKWSKIQNPF